MGERSDDAPLGEWAVTSRRGFAPFLASVVPGVKCKYKLHSVAEMQRVAFKVKGESGEIDATAWLRCRSEGQQLVCDITRGKTELLRTSGEGLNLQLDFQNF